MPIGFRRVNKQRTTASTPLVPDTHCRAEPTEAAPGVGVLRDYEMSHRAGRIACLDKLRWARARRSNRLCSMCVRWAGLEWPPLRLVPGHLFKRAQVSLFSPNTTGIRRAAADGRFDKVAALGHLYVCAVLLRMCFAKMLTSLVSLFDVWSNCWDATASISSRCASNSAGKSRAGPLQRPAKSPSAALLIWHCTICSPFFIVNLNAIKPASYPTASPRVSGMNPAPFQ